MASLRAALSALAGWPRPGAAPVYASAALRRAGILLGLVACGAVLAACGSDEPEGPAQPEAEVELPLQQTADMREAVKAAGCELINQKAPSALHVPDKDFTAADYKTNPPVAGDHSPEWYDDGIYEPGSTPDLGKLIHVGEHGRISVQYKKGTDEETVTKLEALLAESEGYHMLLYENTTDMKYAVAATTWEHAVACPEMNEQVYDALRTFRTRYIDKGPEQVP